MRPEAIVLQPHEDVSRRRRRARSPWLSRPPGGYWFGAQARRRPRSRATARRRRPAQGRARGGAARSPSRREGGAHADAADDHRGRQPALRRIGHAAPRGRRAHRAIQFQEGQRVAKGATLVRLDPAVNQAEVAAGARQPEARARASTTAPSTSPRATSSRARRRTRPRTTCGRRGRARAGRGASSRRRTITRAVLRHHRPALGHRSATT